MRRILLILVVTLMLMTGCFNKLKTYEEIDYIEFNKMVENKESFILYIGSSKCSHCEAYALTINRVITQHQVKVYYIDMAKEENEEFSDKIKYEGTPTTVFITEGDEKSIYNRIDGEQSYDKVIDMFKKNNYIE